MRHFRVHMSPKDLMHIHIGQYHTISPCVPAKTLVKPPWHYPQEITWNHHFCIFVQLYTQFFMITNSGVVLKPTNVHISPTHSTCLMVTSNPEISDCSSLSSFSWLNHNFPAEIIFRVALRCKKPRLWRVSSSKGHCRTGCMAWCLCNREGLSKSLTGNNPYVFFYFKDTW